MLQNSPNREETPPPRQTPLVTGYFTEGPNYAAWRTGGTHDFLLMLTQSGAGRVGWPSGELTTEPGDVVLLRPRTPHDYGTAKNAPGWTFIWVHFVPRPHWAGWMGQWPDVAPGVCCLRLEEPVRPKAEAALLLMHEQAQSGLFRRDEFALNALENALLWCDAASASSRAGAMDERVLVAVQFLLHHLARPVSVGDVSREAGLSPSRLVHLFREQTGQTIGQFVENERMARAKQLLALTSRTVGAIAREVGYENPFYFSLRFKKHANVSPTEWRTRERENASL